MRMRSGLKLAHVWSSDMGAVLSLPHMRSSLAQGWEVTLLCPDGPRLDVVRQSGVTWIPLPLSRRLFDPSGDVTSMREIARICREQRFDIVHTHNLKAGHVGRVVAGLVGGAAVVHTMHGMPFDLESPPLKRWGHIALEWTAGRFADRMLVQSIEDRDTLLRAKTIAPEKVVRVGNGIDLAAFAGDQTRREATRQALGLAAGDVMFLSAGRLVREKGFVELAAATAIARQRDPRIRVLVAGPRDQEKADRLSDEEMDLARAQGLELLGERHDMRELYAAADAVVLVSWREGLPRVLLEGAAMSKPLVASLVRGCREVVVPERGGVLVPVRSPESLADALLRVAADPGRRAEQGRFNRARAEAEYDLRKVIAAIEAVYHQVLA